MTQTTIQDIPDIDLHAGAFPLRHPLPARALVLPLLDLVTSALGAAQSLIIGGALGIPLSVAEMPWVFVLVFALYWCTGLHLLNGYNPTRTGSRQFHVEVVGPLAVLLLAFGIFPGIILRSAQLPAGAIILGAYLAPPLILLGRFIGVSMLQSERRQRPVVVIGAGWAGRTIVQEMLARPAYGYRPVALVDDDLSKHGGEFRGVPIVGGHERLQETMQLTGAAILVLAVTHGIRPEVAAGLYEARLNGSLVIRMPELFEMLTQRVPAQHLPKRWISEFIEGISEKDPVNRSMWRLFNLFAACCVAVAAVPASLVVAALILVTDGRPILFVQQRVGKGEKTFSLYKFRTMRAPKEDEDEGSMGTSWKNRITPIGRILRAARLDELPQLINVFKGDLNLVGPRPFIPLEVDALAEVVPFYRLRFLVEPGITGHAQTLAGYDNKPETALRKLEYDLFYIKHRSIWFDLVIILRTVVAVLSRRGR